MATTAQWMPANGRHPVNIGTSLVRALKARKGAPTSTKRSNLPDRDFYSFRYNFKPPSIDSTKPGTIDVKRGKDSTKVLVEQSSSQIGEGHSFVGKEQLAKDTDCVLIYDEETGFFTLEKLDSYMVLTYDRKTTTNINPPSSSNSTPSKPKEATRDLDLEAQLEQDLMEEDADGEPDDEFEEIIPLNTIALRQEEEEEDEEDIPIASRAPSPPKPKPVRPRKPSEASAAKTKRPSKPKGKTKREASDIEEEDLEFGQPARQTKRARPAPPPEGLAFPGSSSTVRTPSSAYPSPAATQRSSIIPPPSSAPPGGSDSEEEWEPVQPAEPIVIADSEGEEEEEIDMTAFEAEMNLQLEGSDDGLGGAVSPEPPEVTPGRPMSLNQFAGGGVEASQDEDDYSSSDCTEDD